MFKAVPKLSGVLTTRKKDILRLYSDNKSSSGGRCAGSINEAGGIFKQLGVAREAQYFRKKDSELLEGIKRHMNEQIEFHKEQIEVHQESIEKIKEKQSDLKK